jgi:predicted dehydrogenase
VLEGDDRQEVGPHDAGGARGLEVPEGVLVTPRRLDPKVADLGYVAQMQTLGRAVADGSLPAGAPDAAFGRRVLDVVCGAYASAGSGGPVPLPFAGPRDRTPLELWRG